MENGKLSTNRKKSQHFLLSISLMGLLFAATETVRASETPNTPFPLPPRLSANAYASDYTVAQANLMLPLHADTTHNFYINPDLVYGSANQGYADLGLGYRWLKNDAAILGCYVFGGYSRFANNARVWVVNPGIEALGSRWDARFNAYFPMGDRHYAVGDFLGATLGVDVPFFSGHNVLDNLFHVSQYAGNGADVKLGYQLFPLSSLKGYVGSYFFAPAQSNNLWGAAAGLEYWLDPQVKLFTNYTYDSQRHSTIAVGLGVEFGGTHVHRYDPSVEERITDPVERYLSELGRGSVVPNQKLSQLRTEVLANNIAFFSQGGNPDNGGTGLNINNCTFENPCGPTDLTNTGASTLNTLLPNTRMYFNGGNYNALDISGGTNPVTLQTGQSIHSRTADYTQPATGAGRSTFNGAFILPGNNTLDSIILIPTTATASGTGIQINGASSNLINNTQIGSTSNPFKQGVSVRGNSEILIDSSSIFATGTGFGYKGVIASNAARLTILHSIMNVGSNGVGTGNSQGAIVNDTALLTITDSIINLTAFGSDGILTSQNATANITNSQINVQGAGNIRGLTARDNSTTHAVNTPVKVIASQNTATGLETSESGQIQVNNGLLTVSGNSNSRITRMTTGSTIQINQSTCILQGAHIVCP